VSESDCGKTHAVTKALRFVRRNDMFDTRLPVLLLCVALVGFGCAPVILRQDVPVTTNPMGAKIYANGQFTGHTPGTVSLERNRDHVLTLVKDDYCQEDVIIRREYQSAKVLMKAIQSGVNAGTFFKDTQMGMNSGLGSISRQEESGEAYILVPRAVKVSLIPRSAPPTSIPGPVDATMEQSGPMPEGSSSGTGMNLRDALAAGAAGAAVAGAASAKPIEKKWETWSSSRTTTQADGTVVQERSSTSVGVSVNPVGLLNLLNKLAE
jgi:hypothetical protein